MATAGGVAQPEKATQQRVITLLQSLGWRYLGEWSTRAGNSNIDRSLLDPWLAQRGHTAEQIGAAVHKLRSEADHATRGLYGNNQAVYGLLRYGVPVKTEAGEKHTTVHFIDWADPQANDFAVAEEVTLTGELMGVPTRRPDLVLYVNGIAIGVIELKNSRVSLGEGIGQLLSNQQPQFHAWFFSTVQIVFAGNDSEGLRYGTVGTPAKHFLTWKEDEDDNAGYKLDKYLARLCSKARLAELMHDFVLFDGGIKKLPRPHQYFGVKAAKAQVRQRKGGIIWHTQGSGKSIVMVLLARWILENLPQARVAVITDRDELDKQIEGVFRSAGVQIARSSSGRDLMAQLAQPAPRLLCSLVHKFGRRGPANEGAEAKDFDAWLHALREQPSPTVGEVFVFVDECHRTQDAGGKLHRLMKATMPNAVFIGFTGTPLLVKDRATSLEVFGGYIHTYKFSEGVADGVVLDLVYEARDIDQVLGSKQKIDAWFEAKTRALNAWQKDELKRQWGTMQNVLSSRSRMERVVSDVLFDFGTKPRLSSERGNAILVASSIYEACKYYALFQKTPLKGKCALVTSYSPHASDVTKEEIGANTETDKQFVYSTYVELLKDVPPQPGKTPAETYEDAAKARFRAEPANMKLLIVVDKLLTGFDAPPCTYLYLDKKMQDHGLFQAICRTNRLDGDDKEFGYIVDFKDLFKRVNDAIRVYTSELDHGATGASPDVLMQDRLKLGRERLDAALEALELLREPVEPPKDALQYIHHFCGNTEKPADLKQREPLRTALYKGTVALLRAYGAIGEELEKAGYDAAAVTRIKARVRHFTDVREIVRKASGETLDLKPYEADMRHLIDTYIEAEEPRRISQFDNVGLLDLIVKSGVADAVDAQLGKVKGSRDAVAETIENNVRSKIVQERLTNPAFFDKMSVLLDELIRERKHDALEYEAYLKKVAELVTRLQAGVADDTPKALDTPGKRALYDNLNGAGQAADFAVDPVARALLLDQAIREARPAGWRGNLAKENLVKRAMFNVLHDAHEVERLFAIVRQQPEY